MLVLDDTNDRATGQSEMGLGRAFGSGKTDPKIMHFCLSYHMRSTVGAFFFKWSNGNTSVNKAAMKKILSIYFMIGIRKNIKQRKRYILMNV